MCDEWKGRRMKKSYKVIALMLCATILSLGIVTTSCYARDREHGKARLSARAYHLTTDSNRSSFVLRLLGTEGKSTWKVSAGASVVSLKKINKNAYEVTAQEEGKATISVKLQEEDRELKCRVVVTSLEAPNLNAKAQRNSILLKWAKVKNADSYEVYRRTEGGRFRIIRTIQGDESRNYTFGDYTAVKGITYSYKVKAVDGRVKSKDSKIRTLRIPKKMRAAVMR